MKNFAPDPILVPENGISFDDILSKIDESYLDIITCPICQNLVWDIVDCDQCGNLFCRNCIKDATTKVGDSCPICRKSPFQSTECKALKKIFANIKLKCPNKPCQESIEYSDYLFHQEKCKYRKYHCIIEGCNYENTLNEIDNMEKHSKECPYRMINCMYCKKLIKIINMDNHLNNECEQIVKCYNCNYQMKRSYFNSKHNDLDCLKCRMNRYMDLYNKEKKKLEEDIIKYENMAKDKPYQCSICKKNFSLDVKLKEHMLEHTTIKSEEEMESDENKNIINNENKDNIEEIKEEIKNDKEETIDNNNINNNASTNNNNKIGLGFFGRIMAPIFLTESEINSINGQ